jgi:8-oxo-dGTP diphosphatase
MMDRFYQIFYNCAFLVMKFYWAIFRPYTHGVMVAIWHKESILLVRNSYLRYYSLPGGYVHRGETSLQAAVRELEEETGINVKEEMLLLELDIIHNWFKKKEHIEIFTIKFQERIEIKLDNREVIYSNFFDENEALNLELFPPVYQYIKQLIDKKNKENKI